MLGDFNQMQVDHLIGSHQTLQTPSKFVLFGFLQFNAYAKTLQSQIDW